MEASYSADNRAQVAFGLFDSSHANELMEKEGRTPASCCKSPMMSQMPCLVLALVLQMEKHQGRGLVVWQISELRLSLDVNCSSREQMSALVLCPDQGLPDVPGRGCGGSSPTPRHLPEGLNAGGTSLQSNPGLLLFQAGYLI